MSTCVRAFLSPYRNKLLCCVNTAVLKCWLSRVEIVNDNGETYTLCGKTDGRVAMWLMDGATLTSGAGFDVVGSHYFLGLLKQMKKLTRYGQLFISVF